MAFSIQLWWIEARYSSRNSGHRFVTSLESSGGFPLRSTLKPMARPKGRLAPWKRIFESLSILNKMTGLDSYRWRSLHITMRRTLAPVTHLLRQTAVIILAFLTKKTLIITLNQSRPMNYHQNFENWWLFIVKTSTTLKNFRDKTTIKEQSLEAILPVIKFGWIANISKPNEGGS